MANAAGGDSYRVRPGEEMYTARNSCNDHPYPCPYSFLAQRSAQVVSARRTAEVGPQSMPRSRWALNSSACGFTSPSAAVPHEQGLGFDPHSRHMRFPQPSHSMRTSSQGTALEQIPHATGAEPGGRTDRSGISKSYQERSGGCPFHSMPPCCSLNALVIAIPSAFPNTILVHAPSPRGSVKYIAALSRDSIQLAEGRTGR